MFREVVHRKVSHEEEDADFCCNRGAEHGDYDRRWSPSGVDHGQCPVVCRVSCRAQTLARLGRKTGAQTLKLVGT